MDTKVTALVETDWHLIGLSRGWRRRTGVLRAHLLRAPLLNYVHPADVHQMVALGALLEFCRGSACIRMGYWGQWVEVELTGERRYGGSSQFAVHAAELPKALWWAPTDLGLPMEPAVMAAA